jgi:hypothetical protein
MESREVVLSPSSKSRRLLLSCVRDKLLKAMSPPPAAVRRGRAASRPLESLALRLETRRPVVLSVDARGAELCLALPDERSIDTRSILYRIEVSDRGRLRRRRMRGRGIVQALVARGAER